MARMEGWQDYLRRNYWDCYRNFFEIYRQAKKLISIVDNYIRLKTLEKLINIQDGAGITA